jgi:hypothetical protein
MSLSIEMKVQVWLWDSRDVKDKGSGIVAA